MAGKKGRSGRKSGGNSILSVELLRNQTILKSWAVTKNALTKKVSKNFTFKDKAGIAEKIAGKDIGRKLEHAGGIQINITQAQAEATETANDQLEKQLKAED